MPDRPIGDPIDQLLREAMHDLADQAPLVPDPDALGAPVIVLERPDEDPATRPWIWVALAAAAAALLIVGIVALSRNGDESTEPVDAISPTPAPETARTAATVEAAGRFFEAWGAGDADTVIERSDPVVTNVAADIELVGWWSLVATGGDPSVTWLDGACGAVGSSDATATSVACPLRVRDPVAVELGRDRLTWVGLVSEDLTVRRAAEPLTADLGNFNSVWEAYADYLAAFGEGDPACDPQSVPAGSAWVQSGLPLTKACAELIVPLADDVAQWIRDGRPQP